MRRPLKMMTLYDETLASHYLHYKLVALKHECIWRDSDRNQFLKVELGKLKNERLVPIDHKTILLIQDVQNQVEEYPRSDKGRLFNDPRGRKFTTDRVRSKLKDLSKELNTPPLVSHRLRHTYATELLNAGVGIFSLMKLLGHRHFRMTLRYAEVTQKTIRRDYFKALTTIEQELQISQELTTQNLSIVPPAELLPDLAKWLRNEAEENGLNERTVELLTKRIRRLQADLTMYLKKQ